MSRVKRKFISRLSMAGAFSLPNEYWLSLQVTPQDVENLHTFLFERETPLTTRDLSVEFLNTRVKAECIAAESKQKAAGKSFFPKEKYQIGDELVFPAVAWKQGKVIVVRAGVNPSVGGFDVLTVAMDDGSERMFAANLESHVLNEAPISALENKDINPASILREYGDLIE